MVLLDKSAAAAALKASANAVALIKKRAEFSARKKAKVQLTVNVNNQTNQHYRAFTSFVTQQKGDLELYLAGEIKKLDNERPNVYSRKFKSFSISKTSQKSWKDDIRAMRSDVEGQLASQVEEERMTAKRKWFVKFRDAYYKWSPKAKEVVGIIFEQLEAIVEDDIECSSQEFFSFISKFHKRYMLKIEVQKLMWIIAEVFEVTRREIVREMKRRRIPLYSSSAESCNEMNNDEVNQIISHLNKLFSHRAA